MMENLKHHPTDSTAVDVVIKKPWHAPEVHVASVPGVTAHNPNPGAGSDGIQCHS